LDPATTAVSATRRRATFIGPPINRRPRIRRATKIPPCSPAPTRDTARVGSWQKRSDGSGQRKKAGRSNPTSHARGGPNPTLRVTKEFFHLFSKTVRVQRVRAACKLARFERSRIAVGGSTHLSVGLANVAISASIHRNFGRPALSAQRFPRSRVAIRTLPPPRVRYKHRKGAAGVVPPRHPTLGPRPLSSAIPFVERSARSH